MMDDIMETMALRRKLEAMDPEEIVKMADIMGYSSVTLDLEKNLMIELFLEEKRKAGEQKAKVLQQTEGVQLQQEIFDQQKMIFPGGEKRKQRQEEKERKKAEKKVRKEAKKEELRWDSSDRWLGRKMYRAIFLWVLFGCGFAFAVYKNFTGIDRHTVHERKVVKEVLLDTNDLENFATDFLRAYFSWSEETSGEEREKQLKKFLPGSLLDYGMDMNRQTEKKVTSVVDNVKVWNVKKLGKEYEVTAELVYELLQRPEGEGEVTKKRVEECYQVVIHSEKGKGMKVVRLPILVNVPKSSSYEPKRKVEDSMVNDSTKKEIQLFLKDFFQVYPSLKTSDLKYYASSGVMPKIGNADYELKEDPKVAILSAEKEGVQVEVFVTYQKKDSNVVQTFQYELKLKKGDNWKIVDRQ